METINNGGVIFAKQTSANSTQGHQIKFQGETNLSNFFSNMGGLVYVKGDYINLEF